MVGCERETGGGDRGRATRKQVGPEPRLVAADAGAAQSWGCPMHPAVTAPTPGDCPICGMTLVPVSPAAQRSFGCPMHPDVIQPKAGDCPICGMSLVPVSPPAPRLPDVALTCATATSCTPARPSLVSVIEAALASQEPVLRALAVAAVDDTAQLVALLDDVEGVVREAAAARLAVRGDAKALPALRRASERDQHDPQALARLAALDARLRLGDDTALPALRSYLVGPGDEMTRAAAAGYAGTHAALRDDLLRAAREDASEAVREAAWVALAAQGIPEARDWLRDRWSPGTYAAHARVDPAGSRRRLGTVAADRSRSPVERTTAAAALLAAGDPDGRAVLHELLVGCEADPPPADGGPLLALQLLAERAAAEDVPALLPCLQARDPYTRVAATVAALRVPAR